jgi:hypothetical protein
MAAGSADGDQLAVYPRQHHRIVADVAAHHPVIGDFAERQTLGEVGSGRSFGGGHASLPWLL